MYLRISWGRVSPGRWDEYEAAFKEAVEAAGAVPGLRARVLYRDVDDPDTGYSLSYWDSAEAMDGYETSAAVHDEILPRIQPFFGGAFTTNRVRAVFDRQFD
jgi:heme-degrading monooxygenase HmoA